MAGTSVPVTPPCGVVAVYYPYRLLELASARVCCGVVLPGLSAGVGFCCNGFRSRFLHMLSARVGVAGVVAGWLTAGGCPDACASGFQFLAGFACLCTACVCCYRVLSIGGHRELL